MKVAILTSFQDFNEGHSLSGIVKDQITMLQRHGNEVVLFVSENFNREKAPENVEIRQKIPFAHLIDYMSKDDLTDEHREVALMTQHMLEAELVGFDAVFEHDLNFQGWHMPYGMGLVEASRTFPQVPFMHWVHSVPSGFRDFWNVTAWGNNHRIVFPNKTDSVRVAEEFRGSLSDVKVIPHIKDIRTWFEFGEKTCQFIDEYPAALNSSIVQVLPASTDKLHSKRVREVIKIFSELKKQGSSVFLICANQYATSKQPRQNVEVLKDYAVELGLVNGTDFVFTSDFQKPDFECGIPKRMVRELFQMSNLFVYPTREESFGLVIPEAALAGGVLMVLNKSLTMLLEVSGLNAVYFDFGSYHQNHNLSAEVEKQYFQDIASIIVGRMQENESVRLKTFMKRRYNMDNLYFNYYLPAIKEICS